MNQKIPAILTIIGLLLVAFYINACSPRRMKSKHMSVAAIGFETVAQNATPSRSMNKTIPFDLNFIDSMTKHHQEAIDVSRVALSKANSKKLKSLAGKIIRKQQKEITTMKNYRDKWYPKAAKTPDSDMLGSHAMDMMSSHTNGLKELGRTAQEMGLKQLQEKTGKPFDLEFLQMMIPHHEDAISMAKDAMVRAQHPQLKKLAKQMVSGQTKEINQMNKWKDIWSKK